MSTLAAFDNLKVSGRHRLITLFASGASFIDGYILIIIGVALESLMQEFQLDEFGVGLVTVSTFVGLGVGTFIFGYIGDKIGRKKILSYNILLLALCSVLSAFVTTPTELIIARFFIGVLIGGDYPIATSMVAEFSPIKNRAWSMGTIAAVWYVGGIFATVVGYYCYDFADSWRWMLASAVIPCMLVFFGRMGIPESPRWLLLQGRVEEARAIFKEFGADVSEEVFQRFANEKPKSPNVKKIFKGDNLRNLLFVATIWICQVVPMFTVYMFGTQIMADYSNVTPQTAMICNTVISIAFFTGCFPAMWLVGVIGRRTVCVYSFLIMTVAMGLLYVFTDNLIVLLLCLLVYALAAGGPGILQWLYPNELFSTDIRASSVGVAMSITRVATIFSTFFLYPMLVAYGSEAVVIGGIIISFIGLVVSVFWAPETNGISL